MSEISEFPQYKGRIMYPPRPKLSIPPEKIEDYENKGYVAQLKFNGTRTLVEMGPDNQINLWTRHREPHKAYNLSEALRADLVSIHERGDPNKFLVLDGELMHSKTKGLKDTLILFDILVCDSDHLIGMSMLERYQVLDNMFAQVDFVTDEYGKEKMNVVHKNDWESKTGRKIAIKCSEHIWLAETFIHHLSDVFKSRIDMDEIEGIVLKNPRAPLDRSFSEDNNGDWLIRCRKPHKNYQF